MPSPDKGGFPYNKTNIFAFPLQADNMKVVQLWYIYTGSNFKYGRKSPDWCPAHALWKKLIPVSIRLGSYLLLRNYIYMCICV